MTDMLLPNDKQSECSLYRQELSYRRQKASGRCKIIHYMQHCYGILQFIICNTDVNKRKCGEKKFLKIWHQQNLNSALYLL